MRERLALTTTLLCQAFFLGLVITTAALARSLWFALFWVSTIATLVLVMAKKRWTSTAWLAFGSFSTALITGVLLSLHILHDAIGVGVSVMGLLFIAAIDNALP
ncbi:hypothetical protein GF367_00440 [Candidatus Woesearchaeota archaeon]|nr:hypothetical protein [Candidatus Woesearchaeota archaeon]